MVQALLAELASAVSSFIYTVLLGRIVAPVTYLRLHVAVFQAIVCVGQCGTTPKQR